MFSEDEDDIFSTTPKKKFFDIIYNANRNLVEFEIENILDRYVAMEILLEEKLGDEGLKGAIEDILLNQADKIHGAKSDVFIGFVGDVLTNNE